MFRSTIAIVQNNITGYYVDRSSHDDIENARPPAERVTRSASYFIYETVYQTNHLILGIAIGLMLLAILAILPLYSGFWNLGRKVTTSPIEIAKALHYSTKLNTETERLEVYSVLEPAYPNKWPPHFGSNFSDDELIKLLGSNRVRYGEVAPNVLGIGLEEYTTDAKAGSLYE
jgi:hypothetical protein